MFKRQARPIAVYFSISCFAFALTAFALPANATSPEEVKSVLIEAGVWEVHWQGNSSGIIEFTFEDRGGEVFVKIVNEAWNTSCERNVTIFEDGTGIGMDGCNEPGIVLNYDPGAKEYTFVGESKNVNFKMKPK